MDGLHVGHRIIEDGKKRDGEKIKLETDPSNVLSPKTIETKGQRIEVNGRTEVEMTLLISFTFPKNTVVSASIVLTGVLGRLGLSR